MFLEKNYSIVRKVLRSNEKFVSVTHSLKVFIKNWDRNTVHRVIITERGKRFLPSFQFKILRLSSPSSIAKSDNSVTLFSVRCIVLRARLMQWCA